MSKPVEAWKTCPKCNRETFELSVNLLTNDPYIIKCIKCGTIIGKIKHEDSIYYENQTELERFLRLANVIERKGGLGDTYTYKKHRFLNTVILKDEVLITLLESFIKDVDENYD